MRFKKIGIFISLLCLTITTLAQSEKKVINLGIDHAKFYKSITTPLYRQIDTLSNLYQTGTMLVTFHIGNDGIFDVRCTNSAPGLLKELVSESLLKMDKRIFTKEAVGDYLYLLPVYYDFAYRGHTLEPFLKRVSDIDLKLKEKPVVPDFNLLFDLSNRTSGLIGIKCVFLEGIKIKGKVI